MKTLAVYTESEVTGKKIFSSKPKIQYLLVFHFGPFAGKPQHWLLDLPLQVHMSDEFARFDFCNSSYDKNVAKLALGRGKNVIIQVQRFVLTL